MVGKANFSAKAHKCPKENIFPANACTFNLFEMSDGPPTDFRKSHLSCVCWTGCLSVCLPVWTLESVPALLLGHPPETALAFLYGPNRHFQRRHGHVINRSYRVGDVSLDFDLMTSHISSLKTVKVKLQVLHQILSSDLQAEALTQDSLEEHAHKGGLMSDVAPLRRKTSGLHTKVRNLGNVELDVKAAPFKSNKKAFPGSALQHHK